MTEWGSDKSRIEQLVALGFKPTIATQLEIDDGINAARAVLPACQFDAEACSEGIKALKSYRKEWNEEMGRWRDKPFHNWASDGADAFRYLAIMHREQKLADPPPAKAKAFTYVADPETGTVMSSIPMNEIIKRMERKAKRGL